MAIKISTLGPPGNLKKKFLKTLKSKEKEDIFFAQKFKKIRKKTLRKNKIFSPLEYKVFLDSPKKSYLFSSVLGGFVWGHKKPAQMGVFFSLSVNTQNFAPPNGKMAPKVFFLKGGKSGGVFFFYMPGGGGGRPTGKKKKRKWNFLFSPKIFPPPENKEPHVLKSGGGNN